MSADLLVCDLDGTLLDASLTLDPALVRAFRRAADRGLLITIATGRMPAAVERYRDELGISVPMIFYNGALVRDHVAGHDLLTHTLPRGVLASAYGVFANAPVDPLFFRDERLYCLALSLPVRGYCDAEGLRAHVIADPPDFLGQGAFVKGLFIGHPQVLPVVRGELEEVVGGQARLLRTHTNYLELLPPAVSKGAAMRELAAHLGVPLDRVVAVGDEENDIEMLKWAGIGVAMSGASAAVRAAADRIAPTPAGGGLLALLRELLPQHFD
ncbi:MAG TPA: Cof-type HAD-IIB family hydrolase [Candidatus Methylomirabilis sp.]|nr:Cof-type HAD-IIB family hydrolase [Candidatus Methylomirabilis sp.]